MIGTELLLPSLTFYRTGTQLPCSLLSHDRNRAFAPKPHILQNRNTASCSLLSHPAGTDFLLPSLTSHRTGTQLPALYSHIRQEQSFLLPCLTSYRTGTHSHSSHLKEQGHRFLALYPHSGRNRASSSLSSHSTEQEHSLVTLYSHIRQEQSFLSPFLASYRTGTQIPCSLLSHDRNRASATKPHILQNRNTSSCSLLSHPAGTQLPAPLPPILREQSILFPSLTSCKNTASCFL
jgi:hypothetical protein